MTKIILLYGQTSLLLVENEKQIARGADLELQKGIKLIVVEDGKAGLCTMIWSCLVRCQCNLVKHSPISQIRPASVLIVLDSPRKNCWAQRGIQRFSFTNGQTLYYQHLVDRSQPFLKDVIILTNVTARWKSNIIPQFAHWWQWTATVYRAGRNMVV